MTPPPPTDAILGAFVYIKATKFFPRYCPRVTNWRNKLRGKNGRGNTLAFSSADLKQISAGLQAMARDLQKQKP